MIGLTLFLSTAFAYSAGKTNNYNIGCGSCHGATATSSTTAEFFTDYTTVAPGETVTITFTVSSTDAAMTYAGMNVGTATGALGAGTGTKVASSQITHNGKLAMSSGVATFDFTWTAPSTEGSYLIEGSGNAVNNNSASSGDAWNMADDLIMVVDDGCIDNDEDGIDTCAGDCNDEEASVYPGATEVCDGLDNDCDGVIDPDTSTDAGDWWVDMDADGYGDSSAESVKSCDGGAGLADNDLDCDDMDVAINPDAEEICDGEDNNCDGTVDEGAPDLNTDGDPDCTDGDDDGDGLLDEDEARYGTDPYNPDTDGDGINDGDEVASGTDPTDAGDPGSDDGGGEGGDGADGSDGSDGSEGGSTDSGTTDDGGSTDDGGAGDEGGSTDSGVEENDGKGNGSLCSAVPLSTGLIGLPALALGLLRRRRSR